VRVDLEHGFHEAASSRDWQRISVRAGANAVSVRAPAGREVYARARISGGIPRRIAVSVRHGASEAAAQAIAGRKRAARVVVKDTRRAIGARYRLSREAASMRGIPCAILCGVSAA
jgi:hypothetical protein